MPAVLSTRIVGTLNSPDMPKYFAEKVCGHWLYFTTHCLLEAMHVHASDRQLTETGSAKLFVKSDGSTVVITPGKLTDKELRIVRAFIKDNYKEMYIKWSEMSNEGFYRGK